MPHNDAPLDDDAHVKSLFVEASEFATSALEIMMLRNAANPELLERIKRRYVDLKLGLELEFVLPGLTAEERTALAGVLKARHSLSIQFGGRRPWRTDSDRASHSEVTRNLKLEFLRQKKLIEGLELEKQLDPLQRRILRHEFLSVPSEKGDSTTFTFRKESPTPETPDEWQSAPAVPPSTRHTDENASRSEQSEAPPSTETGQKADSAIAADADSKPVPSGRSYDLKGKSVLFFGDKGVEHTTLAAELSEAGLEVHLKSDLKDALESAIDSPPDLVTVDLTMPNACTSNFEESEAYRFLRSIDLLNDQSPPPIIGLGGDACFKPALDFEPALTATLRRPVSGRWLLQAVCVALGEDTSLKKESQPEPSESNVVIA
jgi:CheY-like chemotaxis protein